MIEVLKAIARFLAVAVLDIWVLTAVVGSLWVLRVAIDWWLNIDYVEAVKKWLNK